MNKCNIANIIDGENGIGIIDSFGNPVTENEYDEISLEIKVTAKNKKEHIEKIIEIEITIIYKIYCFIFFLQ